MVCLAQTDEQRLLADNLHRLLGEDYEFKARQPQSPGTPPGKSLWSALAELGVLGAAFDEPHGGFAGDARSIAVVMEELGTALALEPFMETAVISGRLLQHCVDEGAREAINAIIGGQSVVVLAHSSADSTATSVTAADVGNAVTLSGTVRCVRFAHSADHFLVPAIHGAESVRIYMIPRSTPDLTVDTYRLIDGSNGADLHLRSVTAPHTSWLQFALDSRTALDDALEWGVLANVSETLGIIQALNKATFSYLMTRRQFGSPIGSFQALQHRAADMHIAAEETLAMADAAIESFAAGWGPARSAVVSAAKVVADTASRRIGSEAIQLHGGMGVSDELNVSHYARRLIAIRHALSTADVHRLKFRSRP